MLKSVKKLFIVFMAVCIVASGLMATACSKNGDPSKDGYTVTVLYPDGTPVRPEDSGNTRGLVSATLLGSDGKSVISESSPYIQLNSTGKVHFDYKVPGEYSVDIINVPAGYYYDKDAAKTSAKSANVTVNLILLTNVEYEITVNMPDGTPAKNIDVKLMNLRDVVVSMTTDANGKAVSKEISAGKYDVILTVPDGYGYKPVQTAMTGAPLVINLFDITPVNLDEEHEMDEATLAEWDAALNSPQFIRFDTSIKQYMYTAEMKGDEEVFFSFTAEKTGTFLITLMNDTNYEMKFYKSNLRDFSSDLTISGATNNGNNSQRLSMNEGESCYVSVCSLNGQPHTTNFAVAFSIDPATLQVSGTGEYDLEFKLDYAIVRFIPSVSGKYSIATNTTEYDTRLVVYSNATNSPLVDEDGNDLGNDDKSATDKNCYYVEDVRQDHIGNTYVFRIYIKDTDVEFPVSLKVVITREGEATPPRQYIERPVTTENSDKFADQTGEFNFLDCQDKIVTSKGEDGLWYVEVDGQKRLLVAAITKNIQGVSYSFSNIEYMGEGGDESGGEQSTPQNNMLTVYEDLNKYYDENELVLYMANYRQFIATYATLCNKDGVYAVNDEIKLFLTRYLNQRGADIANFRGGNIPKENYWLLACGYYA